MEHVTSPDGTRIAVETVGGGPPLVLVLGAMCERASGDDLAAALATDFTVYGYDRRGRGDSGDTTPYAVQREWEDLAAVCAVAGGTPMVYGHSSGAVLAARAVAAGLSVSRLVLHEPPWSEQDGDAEAAESSRRIAAAIADGRPGDAAAIFMTDAGVPSEAVQDMRAGPDWAYFERLEPTLAYDGEQVGHDAAPVEQLAGIGVPTLVLYGEQSPPFFAAVAAEVAAALPCATLRCIPGADHGVAPAVLAPLLVAFAHDDQVT